MEFKANDKINKNNLISILKKRNSNLQKKLAD